MSSWDWFWRPPTMRRVRILAILCVAFGAFVACIIGVTLVPSLKAANGVGVTGTFTLTELQSCDRRQPPRQRCDWYGDFLSDDGRTALQDMELSGGLPPGARVGDTVPARDAGSPDVVYRIDDTSSWRQGAAVFAVSFGVFLLGLLVLEPWKWRERLRQRRR